MTDAFGILGLLLLAFSGGGATAPAAKPGIPAGPPPPWPVALPPELPTFPGAGWEYDEPPPPAVQERARQLVSPLWKRGKGSHQTEQTAGRWITYRAEIVRSGRQGIVAYRLKSAAALPAGRNTASAPSSAPKPKITSRSPGVPQKAPAQTVLVSTPSSPAPGHVPIPVPGGVIYTAPAPAPSSALALPVLRRGVGIKPQAPNNDVKLLQQKLGIKADGQFGAGTEQTVRAFQTTQAINKLGWSMADVDGVVGPKTWTALFASPWVRT